MLFQYYLNHFPYGIGLKSQLGIVVTGVDLHEEPPVRGKWVEAVRQRGSLRGHEGTFIAAGQRAACDMVQQSSVFFGEGIDALLYGYRHSATFPKF